jgi:hypothetical protein
MRDFHGEAAEVTRHAESAPSAVGLCCQVLDFHRFRPKQLGSFAGLVPSEGSTGEEQPRGSIIPTNSLQTGCFLAPLVAGCSLLPGYPSTPANEPTACTKKTYKRRPF